MKFTTKIFFSILFIPAHIFAYIDSDFDGVEDALDKCPNSSIIDIVDKDGCVVEKLESPHHFDIILGVKSIKIKDKRTQKNYYLTLQTAQVDYFYKDFSLNVTTSKNSSKMEDTYISFKYKYKYNEFINLYTSFNVVLPTHKNYYDNNEADYGISQSIYYKKDKLSLFGAYRFTKINDEDISSYSLLYQNTNSYMVGFGYNFIKDLYSSISLSSVDSIYKDT
ncbi:MAG: hypothetical protein ABGW74_09645, partial [Campylobacterales bacterium]